MLNCTDISTLLEKISDRSVKNSFNFNGFNYVILQKEIDGGKCTHEQTRLGWKINVEHLPFLFVCLILQFVLRCYVRWMKFVYFLCPLSFDRVSKSIITKLIALKLKKKKEIILQWCFSRRSCSFSSLPIKQRYVLFYSVFVYSFAIHLFIYFCMLCYIGIQCHLMMFFPLLYLEKTHTQTKAKTTTRYDILHVDTLNGTAMQQM